MAPNAASGTRSPVRNSTFYHPVDITRNLPTQAKVLRYVLRGPNAKRPGDGHAGEPCLEAARNYQADLRAFLEKDLRELYENPKLVVVLVLKHRATRFVCEELEDGLSVDLKSAKCADGLNLVHISEADQESARTGARIACTRLTG